MRRPDRPGSPRSRSTRRISSSGRSTNRTSTTPSFRAAASPSTTSESPTSSRPLRGGSRALWRTSASPSRRRGSRWRSSSPDIGQASSDLGKADADLIAAEHDFKRQKELFEAHAASQADYADLGGQLPQGQGRAGARLPEGVPPSHRERRLGVAGLHADLADRRGAHRARREPRASKSRGSTAAAQAVELFTVGEVDPVWVLADVYEMDIGAREGRREGEREGHRVPGEAVRRARGTGCPARSIRSPAPPRSGCTFERENPDRLLEAGEMYATGLDLRSKRKKAAPPFRKGPSCGSETRRWCSSRPGKTPDGRAEVREQDAR